MTEGLPQPVLDPLRQPKRPMMVLPDVVFNEHEKEEPNNGSLFSQLRLELVEMTDGEKGTGGTPAMTISIMEDDPSRNEMV